jgi:SAM-dependent methyltransferase
MANADVQRSGLSAKEHFLQYGQREGRLQWINEKEVAEMREEKLPKIRFRRQPFGPRAYGQAANFIDAETLAEFGIPDAPPVSSSTYGGPFVEEVRHNPDKLCLDVGAGLRFSCFSNVVNTEIYRSFSTDVVCVAEDLPFEDDQFDYIMCISVLEHTLRPWEAARELCRVLKTGREDSGGLSISSECSRLPSPLFQRNTTRCRQPVRKRLRNSVQRH